MIQSRSLFVAKFALLAVACLGGTASAQTPCQTPGGPDVIVGDITGPQNYASNAGREALALGTTSCNQGDVWLNWISNTNQHPVIGGELYRFKIVNGAGRFEQVGLSWLKHGFFALSDGLCCSGCQSTDGSHLGVRCSDPYSAQRNGSQSGLGPRYQVNASTGFFNYPPHHTPSGGNAGRVEVDITDLEATGGTTRYFANCQYVTPDDAASGNQNNNSSNREVSVSGSGTAWTFAFVGATQREVPAIRKWANCESGVTLQDIQIAGEGLLVLGYKTTNLGGGQYHYEYSLYNMNSDRSIRGFTVPIGPGVTLSNVGFRDITYRGNDGIGGTQNFDGTNWAFVNNGSSASWTTSTFASNSNANALRWGTTYSFRFDANAPPNTGLLTLDTFKVVGTLTASIDMPGTPPPPVDSDGDGVFDHLDNCPGASNANQANADNDATGDVCDPCTDTDGDGFGNPGFPNSCAADNCPSNSNANQANFDNDSQGDVCDADDDNDGTPDTSDGCDFDPNKTAPGQCGCGIADTDTDSDGTANCNDGCPNDPAKTAPGLCGCGVADTDSDSDGTPNCNDGCPNDPAKTSPGACGCNVAETDFDGDFITDCVDNCPSLYNPNQEDCDGDLIGDQCAVQSGAAADCNMNGIPDSCDISLGSSQDFNFNGVPDECQNGGVSFCFGNTGCPCANNGAPGRGCKNSNAGSTGALLQGSGNTAPDTMVLTASGERPTSLSIFLQGDATQAPVFYGDGRRCVTGSLKRISTKDAVGGVASYPGVGEMSISAKSASLGDPIAPGESRVYMTYYRDGNAAFCPGPNGSSFNATQSILLVW